jgi:hypothetical protein
MGYRFGLMASDGLFPENVNTYEFLWIKAKDEMHSSALLVTRLLAPKKTKILAQLVEKA